MLADSVREEEGAWWDEGVDASSSRIGDAGVSSHLSTTRYRPLSLSFQHRNSFASSSTSHCSSTASTPTSRVDTSPACDSPDQEDYLHPQLLPMASSLHPTEHDLQSTSITPNPNSRRNSIRSTSSRTSSFVSAYSDYEGEEPGNVSRACSPISLATTFGGGGRGGHRSRTTSGDRALSPDVPFDEPAPRDARSNSFDSTASGRSTVGSFSQSVASHRTFCGRRFAPNIAARQSSMAFARESVEITSGSAMKDEGSQSRDIDREIRSTPGVMGLGEGWVGGPIRQKSKKQGGWLRWKGKRETNTDGVDPLALWTVPEETKASPIKAAWNRSRARFGASVPALGLQSPLKSGGERSLGQRTRSVFSSSRADLRATPKTNGSMIELGGKGLGFDIPNSPLPHSSTQAQGSPSLSWQPYNPPPRSASLPPSHLTEYATGAPATPVQLSRSGTFGRGHTRGEGSREALPRRSDAAIAEVSPSVQSDIPTPRRNLLHRVKSSLSALSGALRSKSSQKASAPSSPFPEAHPLQPDSPRPLAVPLRVGSRPRPVSIVPLAPEALDSPHTPVNDRPRIQRSQSVKSLLNKFKRRSSTSKLQDLTLVIDDRFQSPEKLKRRSFSGTIDHIPQPIPQSRSDSNLLDFKRSSWREELDDLINRLKEVQVPGEEGGLGSSREAGTRDASARASSELERNNDDDSAPQLGSSLSATTGSSVATPTTPSPTSRSPIRPETFLSPGLSPRPPSIDFAWAAQPARKIRTKSEGSELLEIDSAQRWMSSPGVRSVYDDRA